MVSACNYDNSVPLTWQVRVMTVKVKVFGTGLYRYGLFGHMTRLHHSHVLTGRVKWQLGFHTNLLIELLKCELRSKLDTDVSIYISLGNCCTVTQFYVNIPYTNNDEQAGHHTNAIFK